MESEGALSEIAGRAAEHKLPFLVGGGYAVIANGFKRATFDLDLIISRADKPAWIEALQTLGYTLFSENASFLQLTSNSEALMPLDLMLVDPATFEKLSADAQPMPIPQNARAVSLLHLIALKCHAFKFGHRGRIEKDIDDIIGLIKANNVDVRRPEVQTVILKHGTPELYEKLCRSTTP